MDEQLIKQVAREEGWYHESETDGIYHFDIVSLSEFLERFLARIDAEVRAEAQEPESCPNCDGTGDVHSRDGEWRGECNCGAAQYNMIDRLLRNTFDDEDYAVYSAALDVVAAPQPPAPCPKCVELDRWLEAGVYFTTAEYMVEVENLNMLQAKVADLTREVAQWKNNHATVVRQARVLKERTDMPLERVKAYEHYGEMIERVAELEKEVEVAKSAARYHATQTNEVTVVVAEQSAEIKRLTVERQHN